MFIHLQKIKKDENGRIISGSASVCKSVYDSNAVSGHSKQVTVFKLGKVIWLSPDKTAGIFFTPDKGVYEYNVKSDESSEVNVDDPRLVGTKYVNQVRQRATFGDVS